MKNTTRLNKLRKLRQSKNLTMKQVSSEIGVSESCYCLYENGHRRLTLDILTKLSKVFGCSIADFLEEKEEKL